MRHDNHMDRLDGEPPNSPIENGDRRSSQRSRTVFRIAPIVANGDQGLAQLRNISDGGVKLRTALPLALGDRTHIILSPSFSLEGHVVWVDGNECGIQFVEPIDSERALRESHAEAHGPGARAPRLPVIGTATIETELGAYRVELCDVSQGGLKVTHDGFLVPDSKVRVTLPSGARRHGVVRWSKDGHAGIMLTEKFSPNDLGQISKL